MYRFRSGGITSVEYSVVLTRYLKEFSRSTAEESQMPPRIYKSKKVFMKG